MPAPVKKQTFTADPDAAPLRLDQAVALHLQDTSRETAKKLIRLGAVWLNGRRVQVLSRRVSGGDRVTVYRGRVGLNFYYEINPANILYRDDWLLFYRKEPGIPTQGVVCDNYNNLYAGLVRYLRGRQPAAYLGMHHRLDMDTSGAVVFTVNAKINRSIHYQFKTRRAHKTYLALVQGRVPFRTRELTTSISRDSGRYQCRGSGPGKTATTLFTRLKAVGGWTLLRAEPGTGRTHQIRLQLAFLGFPIVGDRLYGGAAGSAAPRTMLHAESLTIFHPLKKSDLTVTADMFDDMERLTGRVAP